MTGAVPPPVAPAAPAAATPAAPVVLAEATVVRLPERLQEVGRTVMVGGTVAGETPDGLTRVRTAAGEVLVKSPTPLPADRPVTLQIAAGSPPGRALVLTQPAPAGPAMAAQPGGTGSAAAVLLSTAPTVPAPPTATTPLPPLAAGTVLPAVVIAAAPRPSGTTAAAAPPGVAAPPAAPAQPPPPPAAGPAATAAPAPGGPPVPAAAAPPVPPVLPGLASPAPTPPVSAQTAPAGGMATGGVPTGTAPAQPTAAPASVTPGSLMPGTATPATATSGVVTTMSPPPSTAVPTVVAVPPAASAPTAAAPPPDQPDPANAASPQVGPASPAPAPVPAGAAAPRPAATPAEPAGAAPSAPPQPADSEPAAPGPTGTGRTAPPPPAPTLAQGATVALRILSVALPGAPEAPAASPLPATADGERVLSGTVAGVTNQGQPILATGDGMLALNTRAGAPPGTRITAALAEPGRPPAAVAAAPPPDDPVALAAAGRDWPVLRQVLASLGGLDRALAQSLVGSVLPQPNRRLGAALAFFLSAARGGDARGWLGAEAADALQRSGQGRLLDRLEREFREASQAPEAAAGEWRPVAIPMLDTTGLHPVRVCVRPIGEEEADEGAERRERGSRFLIDVDLSRLGPLQLDGLVRERRFDLILRSHAALTPELRQELTRVFADSLAAVGYAGGLSFQSGARSWVALTRGAGGLGVTA